MRFPGRILDVEETPPTDVLAFIAEQVAVPASELAGYRSRSTNRREHIAELMHCLGCRDGIRRPDNFGREREGQ
jgi:TnpA family transposase